MMRPVAILYLPMSARNLERALNAVLDRYPDAMVRPANAVSVDYGGDDRPTHSPPMLVVESEVTAT